jgi:hypothetical protein
MGMANGDQMSPGKLIIAVITLSMSINGIGVILTNSAVDKQGRDIEKLRDMVYEQMDDRYRRFEANAAHQAIIDRIMAGEHRDDRLENEIKTHIIADDKIHQ